MAIVAANHICIFKGMWKPRHHSDWMVQSRWETPFSHTSMEKLHLEVCLCCLFIRKKQTTWKVFRESNKKCLKGWRETAGHVSKAWKLNVYSLCKKSLRRGHDDVKYKYKGGRVERITVKAEDVQVRKGRCTRPYEENFPENESYRTMDQSSKWIGGSSISGDI